MSLSVGSKVHQVSSRAIGVRRKSGKRYDKRYTAPTWKHPPSHMIWCAMPVLLLCIFVHLKPLSTEVGTLIRYMKS